MLPAVQLLDKYAVNTSISSLPDYLGVSQINADQISIGTLQVTKSLKMEESAYLFYITLWSIFTVFVEKF